MKAVLASLILLLAVTAANAAEIVYFPAQTSAPLSLATSGDIVYILDAANGTLLSGNPRSGLTPVEVTGRPRGAGSDEKGQTVVVTGDASGYKAHIFTGGRKLRSFDLKPTAKLVQITDVAIKNEIIWLLQQTPPLVVLFGADGAELSRSDLSSVARAPFSLALGPSGEGYVTDPIAPAVLELNAFGQYKTTHKLAGTGFTRPTGITSEVGGRLWISDTILGEVAPFALKEKTLEKLPAPTSVTVEDPIRLSATGDALWVLSGWNAKLAKITRK